MGRSQRRKVLTQWHSSSGALLEQGALSDSVKYDLGAYSVPIGPAGGPLKGSSLAGPAPTGGNPAPTCTLLSPNTAVHGGAQFTLTVTGTGFVPNATFIIFNGGVEATTYISPTQVSTIVKPALVSIPIVVPVQVSNGIVKSDPLNFTFT